VEDAEALKVLFCIKSMDSLGGRAERVLAAVASGLAERGHQVQLLSFDAAGAGSFYELSPKIERVFIGSGKDKGPSKSLRVLRHIVRLRGAIRRMNPDISVGFMHSAYIPLGLALVGTGYRVIASEHIVPEHYRSRPLQAALLQLTPFLVSIITCVSEQVRLAFSPFLRKKMVVMPNPLSTESKTRADVLGEGKQRKTVLTVGRMDRQKDHQTLIEAFARIADEFPDWDLRIVGEGELHRELAAKIAALGMEQRIFLPGVTKQISDEYQAAQLYVQPSRYESFGLTVVESLSHGLPAIGFKTCLGVNELIRDGRNGLLVDGNGDRVSALADGLRKLMADTGLRLELSKTGIGPMEENRIDRALDRWEDLLADETGARG